MRTVEKQGFVGGVRWAEKDRNVGEYSSTNSVMKGYSQEKRTTTNERKIECLFSMKFTQRSSQRTPTLKL